MRNFFPALTALQYFVKCVFSRIMIEIPTLGKLREDSLNLRQCRLYSEFKIARAKTTKTPPLTPPKTTTTKTGTDLSS